MPSQAITIWSTPVTDTPKDVWPRLNSYLSGPERIRASRFRFDRHRQEYIAAHALKRWIISSATGQALHDIEFTVGPYGKPMVAKGNRPYFNLTHCRGIVACGLSDAFELGVDAENLMREPPLDEAENFFTAKEISLLRAAKPSEQALIFLKLWTLKEAVIKATGMGLSQGLKTFSISVDPPTITFPAHGTIEPLLWRLHQVIIGEKHVLAVAWNGADVDIEFKTVKLAELAKHLDEISLRLGKPRASIDGRRN